MWPFINQVDKIFNFSNPHPPHQQNNMETQIWSNCTVDRALKYCPLLYMEKMVWIRMQTLWRSWIPRECKRIKRIPKSSKKSKEFQKSPKIPKHFKPFKKVKKFQKNLKQNPKIQKKKSIKFQKFQESKFQQIPKNSKIFKKSSKDSKRQHSTQSSLSLKRCNYSVLISAHASEIGG